jgi:hypothetical protein
MATKVIVLVLAAFLASSVLADKPSITHSLEKIVNGAYDTLVEIVEQVLLGINELFSLTYHELAYGLISMFEALGDMKDIGIQLAQKVIDDEIAIINAWIDKHKNETSEENKVIWQCIISVEDEAARIQNEAYNSSLTCIDVAVQTLGDEILQILLDMKNANEDLKKQEKTLETCKNETSPVDCIKTVLDNLWDIIVDMTTLVETDADKAQTDFDNIEAVTGKCISDATAIVEVEKQKVTEVFNQCVADGASTPSVPSL